MFISDDILASVDISREELISRLQVLEGEADRIRETDRIVMESLFKDFYGIKLNVGVGFQRAFGSVLSGDYFELILLPDNNYLFVFADISGHGLPAYTTLIRLRSAISFSLTNLHKSFHKYRQVDSLQLVRDIGNTFTDLMDRARSKDFASILFTFITNENDKFHLNFYSRGMHFPVIVRKFQNNLVDIYNLSIKEKGWSPEVGYLLGREIRKIAPKEFDNYPNCRFTIYEGDRILFFSDGIIEAYSKKKKNQIFGMARIMEILSEQKNEMPQRLIENLFSEVFQFIEDPHNQEDDMTSVLIDFPLVR